MSDDAFGPGLDHGGFLDDLAKGLGFDTRPGFMAMKTQMQERALKDRAVAGRINRLFSTADGQKVLEWLVANTLRRDEVPVDMLLTHRPDQVMAYSIFRAGENAAVKMILLAMAQAQNKPSKRRNA